MNSASRVLVAAIILVSVSGISRAAQQTAANANRPIESLLEIPQLDATIGVPSLKREATMVANVMRELADMTRVTIHYDQNVPELTRSWTGNLVDVPLDKALASVLTANGIAFTVLGPRELFAYSDTPANREKYGWVVRTFEIVHADPSTLAALLNRQVTLSSTGIRPIVVPSNLSTTLPPRTIRVRATGEKMAVVAKIIAENDKSGLFNPEFAVVFPAEKALSLLKQCSRVVPESAESGWVPGADVIRQFELALAPVLREALGKVVMEGAHLVPLSEYYRQYAGLVIAGRRLVYVNGFYSRYLETGALIRPPRPAPNWREVPVMVCDGWTNYFGAEFDPATQRVQNLRFNGRAF